MLANWERGEPAVQPESSEVSVVNQSGLGGRLWKVPAGERVQMTLLGLAWPNLGSMWSWIMQVAGHGCYRYSPFSEWAKRTSERPWHVTFGSPVWSWQSVTRSACWWESNDEAIGPGVTQPGRMWSGVVQFAGHGCYNAKLPESQLLVPAITPIYPFLLLSDFILFY